MAKTRAVLTSRGPGSRGGDARYANFEEQAGAVSGEKERTGAWEKGRGR